MKQTFKIVSTFAIISFGILWIIRKFTEPTVYNTSDIRTILVLIYLFTSLRYYQMEIKHRNSQIDDLEAKLAAK
ncbi:hypothetical protein LZ575_07245 [Antarcticibacterium sp. 1MA-6-2]|uniref:hypothetical protein n=1 Tax=Antarcticibacterium sp. 1MA-6-2 TaxID=2908210 RepID=UPI001F238B0C|nr:hypothetical protein [Antarcticibacterium sp. 1MA-6-2]UJH92318.1 hypothetical protein LZ575_07245 [Antarcticibacterium sp. 1MA-6-2]